MKLLCFGDTHLGAGSDYGREWGERLRDQERVLERIVEIGRAHEVDYWLFAGDAFERRRPTPSEMLALSDSLMDMDGRVVGIVGNHDVEAFDRPTAVDVFGWADIVSKPDVWTSWSHSPEYRDKCGPEKKLAVARLPWTPVSNLVARNGGGDRDELQARAAELLLDTARDLRAQMPQVGPKILLLHWSVSGASVPSGVPTDELREPVIPAEELAELGFDAIVCGHIHKAQVIREMDGGPMFYVGSPMPLNFGEANVPHGVWILHLEGGRARQQFVPIESRPFVTLDFPSFMANRMVSSIEGHEHDVESAIVKVRYHDTSAEARKIDHAAIRQALLDAGAWKVYAIEASIEREQRARVEGLDEGISPGEALHAYASANDIDDDTETAMQRRTGRYLEAVGS